MPEYVLCPVCNNPAVKGEACAVCEQRRAAQAAAPAYTENVQYAAPQTAQYNALFEAPEQTEGRDYRRLMEKTFAPMGAWSIFGTLLLFSVPVLGFIFAVIFACGACRKKQKRALARGYLLVCALSLLLSLLFFGTVFALFQMGLLPHPYGFAIPLPV